MKKVLTIFYMCDIIEYIVGVAWYITNVWVKQEFWLYAFATRNSCFSLVIPLAKQPGQKQSACKFLT
jgi:hypothetical protein